MKNKLSISLRLATVGLALGPCVLPATALAQGQRAPSPWKPNEADFVIKDFKFLSGETLPSLKIHYSTLGTPRRDGAGHVTNAIMLLHGTGGSGRGFASANFGNEVYGPGQVFDITRY